MTAIKVTLLSLLAMLFFLGGCTQSSSDQIDIGVISPLTGTGSSYGDPSVKATVLAAEEINRQGGILGKKINLIIEDGACDAKTAISAANKLIETDGVKIILGGHCSTESLSIAPIVNEKKVLQMATITSSADYSNAGDYSFRNWPTATYYVGAVGKVAFENGARKTALLTEQKDFSISAKNSFQKQFLAFGGEIVSDQSFLSSELDLRSYLQKIKNDSNIDSIYFSSQGDSHSTIFFKQMKELGLLGQYKIFTDMAGTSQKVFNDSGGLNAGSMTVAGYADPTAMKTRTFLESYKEKYGQYPQTDYFYATTSYDQLFVIKDGIEQCQSTDVDCIKQFLYELQNWEGASGKLSFDANGDALTSIAIHSFDQNGQENWQPIQ